MHSDFLEALERQEIRRLDEEEEVQYRAFSYCPASADHQHQIDVYDVSVGTIGKCTCCGRTFRRDDLS